MANILCLAHYCDTHGPTPVMVTEGVTVECTYCSSEDEGYYSTRRPSTSSRSRNTADNNITQKGTSRTSSSSSTENRNPHNSSAIADTPPESPRVQPSLTAPFPLSRDSSFRKTYDENDKKRANPCENCALTLPPKTNEDDLTPDPTVLRTRKPYERVSRHIEECSPPKSASSSDLEASDSESDVTARPPPSPERSRTEKEEQGEGVSNGITSSNASSFSSTVSHDHYLDYTSSHEPLLPTSFSVVRQSCLRTLTLETHPAINPSSICDPIFFGDPQAGYTIALQFRINDPQARGRRRQYALILHSTHKERVAMSIFTKLGSEFKSIAAWIQKLSEEELQRKEASSYGLHSPGLRPIDEHASQHRRASDGHNSSGTSAFGSGGGSAFSRLGNSTPNSAFASGRARGSMSMEGKFAGMSLKGRGIAELVGLPDFFIELHKRFVLLLLLVNRHIGK